MSGVNGKRVELWTPIAVRGLEAWEVSTMGNFRRLTPGNGTHAGRPRKKVLRRDRKGRVFWTISFPDPSGRMRNITRRDGRRKCVSRCKAMKIYKVAALVLRSFVGPPPAPHYIASHLNDVATDDRIENLAWETRAVNNRRRYLNEQAMARVKNWRQIKQMDRAWRPLRL
jgi:hypothetical protein